MLLSYLRTICLYLVLILVVRLMGKRQIGEMEPAEFVVTMLIANLAAIPMQDWPPSTLMETMTPSRAATTLVMELRSRTGSSGSRSRTEMTAKPPEKLTPAH